MDSIKKVSESTEKFLKAALRLASTNGTVQISRDLGEALLGFQKQTEERSLSSVFLCSCCGMTLIPSVNCSLRILRMNSLGRKAAGRMLRRIRKVKNVVKMKCFNCGNVILKPGATFKTKKNNKTKETQGKRRISALSTTTTTTAAISTVATIIKKKMMKKEIKVSNISDLAQQEEQQSFRQQQLKQKAPQKGQVSTTRNSLNRFLKEIV